MLGDLIRKTCAEVLQITMVLVSSSESIPWPLFVPDKFPSEESVFVAFHFYGAGYYDSTRKAEEGKSSHDTKANSSCDGRPFKLGFGLKHLHVQKI